MGAFAPSALSVFFLVFLCFLSCENVASFYSSGGLVFGIVNIVGNFGAVFADQAYKTNINYPNLVERPI